MTAKLKRTHSTVHIPPDLADEARATVQKIWGVDATLSSVTNILLLWALQELSMRELSQLPFPDGAMIKVVK